jgi:ABC-type lipoprotein release transport system permease subunit
LAGYLLRRRISLSGGEYRLRTPGFSAARFYSERLFDDNLLLAAVVSVLLIVFCLNVSNLLFARGLHRRREMMIRATLGASRWRVVRQLLLETILLTSIGGIAGLFVANVCVQATKGLMPADLYRLQELHVDSNALACIFALILITSLLAGLLPAWSLSQVVLAPALKDEGGRDRRTASPPNSIRPHNGAGSINVCFADRRWTFDS